MGHLLLLFPKKCLLRAVAVALKINITAFSPKAAYLEAAPVLFCLGKCNYGLHSRGASTNVEPLTLFFCVTLPSSQWPCRWTKQRSFSPTNHYDDPQPHSIYLCTVISLLVVVCFAELV